MQIYITRNGNRLGPYDEEQLTDKLNSGEISYDDLGWVEGMVEWLPLRQIVVPPAGSPPPPPPPPPIPLQSMPAQAAVTGTGSIGGQPQAQARDTLGMTLVALPFAAIAIMLTGLCNSTLLVLAVVIASAVLVGVDAKKLGIGGPNDLNKKGKRNTGPTAWAISQVILWIICYPAYLFLRRKFGAKNFGWLGLVGGVAMLVVSAIPPVTLSNQLAANPGDPPSSGTPATGLPPASSASAANPVNLSSIEEAQRYVLGVWTDSDRPANPWWTKWVVRPDGIIDVYEARATADNWGEKKDPIRYKMITGKYDNTGHRYYAIEEQATQGITYIINPDGTLRVGLSERFLTKGDRFPFSK